MKATEIVHAPGTDGRRFEVCSLPTARSASDGFAAASDAVSGGAATRAAGLVHFRNHARFQQGARRGESDFMRALILDDVIPPLVRRQFLFHLSKDGPDA